MVPLDGGRGCIRDSLSVRDVVREFTVRYQRRIESKSYFYGFQQNTFPRKYFPTKGFSKICFQRNAFHEMQENNDGEKSLKPGLLILSVGRIERQQLLDISAD